MASGESGFIKGHKELLVDAEKKIGALENELREAAGVVEMLKRMNANYRVAITALGEHYKLTGEAMKEIIDAYQERFEQEYLKRNEESKKEFMETLKKGGVPKFTVIDNPDAPKE